MIASLRGRLLEKHPNFVTIDAGGVGYAVTVPVSTFSQIGGIGEEVRLLIYTHVREDTLALYGFAGGREKELFEKLITISGIGPRLAVTILSGLPTDELLDAIRVGDAKRLTRIPGVGRKTGERIALELREKLEPLDGEPREGGSISDGMQRDVVSTLVNLGCNRAAADKAVRKAVAEGAPVEFELLFRRSMELISR
ncbi:MAG: Holliday junction branch migration protein RuvA [Bryobacterales bacterium]|nr:Holliday junction branch migration protein RuvA [Bryobacterales bacterium]MDE0293570.1 Holliday junction branch migration protein RuvA [Bryobacterales bacterium]MDE0433415.1 Holliday junction branch migration protein RuvA [Bryobacterales bacterium]